MKQFFWLGGRSAPDPFFDTMRFDLLRKFCLSFPGATEDVQWENDLLFRVGGKIFAVVSFDSKGPQGFSFKCTLQQFAELIKRKGVIPAPYVARYHWIMLENLRVLPAAEIKSLIRESYRTIYQKLPQKLRLKIGAGGK